MTKILLPLLFFTMALGELQRLPGLPLYAHDLLIVGLLAINYRLLKIFRPVVWFGLAAAASLILAAFKLPGQQVFIGSWYLIRFLTYSLLAGIRVDPLYLIGFSSLVAAFGLIQYLLVPDTRFLFSLNWDEHYYRLISSLFDPNFTGIILVLGLILVYFYRPKAWGLYLLHLSALLLTYSRSSYLALMAAVLAIALLKRKLQLLLITVAVLLIALPVLPRPGGEGVKLERITSVRQRLSNYQLGLKFWRQSPVLGLGFNTLRYFRDNPASHSASGLDSSLIFVLATSGAAGLLAYGYLLLRLWQNSLVVKITLAALLVHSLFVNSLFYSFTLIWLWSVVDG
jgi:hypothetical protein